MLRQTRNTFDVPAASIGARVDEVDEAARILVRGERPGRAVRVQVSIDVGLLARIDRVAKNRSRFLADAARAPLAGASA
jgi:hypothetical protein